MKRGMTLVEMLVSLTIMMVVLGAIFSILHIQQSKALNAEKTTVLETDAQVALTLLRWDLFMAGYGMAHDDTSLVSINSSNGPDQITLRGAGLGFEAEYTDWSPVLERVAGGDEVLVYRFNDTMPDFAVGDNVIIVDQQKSLLHSDCLITEIDTTTYTVAGFTLDGLRVRLNQNVYVSKGSIVFRPDTQTYTSGINYSVVNNSLMRGNQTFLDNVEDIQFAYGVDLDNNGTFENAEWFNELTSVPGYSPQLLYNYKTAIRSTFVIRSEQRLRDYTYPADACTLEDHVYVLSPSDKRFKREFVNAITWPRNLQ